MPALSAPTLHVTFQCERRRAVGTKIGSPREVDDAEHIVTAKRMKADGHTGKDMAQYLG